ncbi:hypothetical protein EDC63_101616 [Sulfurirhabdus autotrophica]|uniref:Uncharacterized protein n=1 Tax=Sulfurirhabdus autotrophica TaxID=1706046 RepID=A0A4R3YFE6_9PROT|nr:hypothetical protein EDC63_101616 [Sulfurirhabdus autotrophica]
MFIGDSGDNKRIFNPPSMLESEFVCLTSN